MLPQIPESAVNFIYQPSMEQNTPSRYFTKLIDAGFTICSVINRAFTFYFVNHKGLEIYRYEMKYGFFVWHCGFLIPNSAKVY
jgi:hypothetical protein